MFDFIEIIALINAVFSGLGFRVDLAQVSSQISPVKIHINLAVLETTDLLAKEFLLYFLIQNRKKLHFLNFRSYLQGLFVLCIIFIIGS